MASFCAILFLLAAPVFAQTVGGGSEQIHQWAGGDVDDFFGRSVSDAGDVNGDGFADTIVGAPTANPGGLIQAGSAYVYSGADGSLLHQWDGGGVFDFFGWSVSGAGDVNRDGFADVIVGAYSTNPGGLTEAGSVYVYSGLDGSLLHQLDGGAARDRFGYSVSGAGDVNGDGFADVIVGAYDADPGGLSGAGSAYVYSGADGSLLHQWDGGAADDRYGFSVSGAGDVNADGFADVIVGAYAADPGGLSGAGSTYVYSGVNGSLLHQWDGGSASEFSAYSVSGAGDVNADGFADVIVGAWGTVPGGLLLAGSAKVYSGADGSLLHQWDGGATRDLFGWSVSGAGDVNGDGFADVIVGAHQAAPGGRLDAGSAYLYSGRDGSLLYQWDGGVGGDFFGFSVSGAGDVNGDGFANVIVGAHLAGPGGLSDAGSAHVYTWNPYIQSTADTISDTSAVLIGLELSFPQDAALFDYRVLLSFSGTGPFSFGIDIPLSPDNSFVNSYYGSYPFPLSSQMQGTLDSNARALATFGKLARTPSGLVGTTFHLAAIASQPGQLPRYSSVAVPLEIVP